MVKVNTFSKKEHLCGEIRINNLFLEAKAFIAYPIRIMYKYELIPSETPVLVMVTVPKRRFKRAAMRNRIKRLMRESYRLNKQELNAFCTENGIALQISFAYVSNDELPFETIKESMKVALFKIQTKLESKLPSNNSDVSEKRIEL